MVNPYSPKPLDFNNRGHSLWTVIAINLFVSAALFAIVVAITFLFEKPGFIQWLTTKIVASVSFPPCIVVTGIVLGLYFDHAGRPRDAKVSYVIVLVVMLAAMLGLAFICDAG